MLNLSRSILDRKHLARRLPPSPWDLVDAIRAFTNPLPNYSSTAPQLSTRFSLSKLLLRKLASPKPRRRPKANLLAHSAQVSKWQLEVENHMLILLQTLTLALPLTIALVTTHT